jgi:hypothetical protein
MTPVMPSLKTAFDFQTDPPRRATCRERDGLISTVTRCERPRGRVWWTWPVAVLWWARADGSGFRPSRSATSAISASVATTSRGVVLGSVALLCMGNHAPRSPAAVLRKANCHDS